jgi:hypothetical protein
VIAPSVAHERAAILVQNLSQCLSVVFHAASE